MAGKVAKTWPRGAAMTDRQYTILADVAQGLPIKAIARRLGISRHTVHATLQRLKRQTQTQSLAHLVWTVAPELRVWMRGREG